MEPWKRHSSKNHHFVLDTTTPFPAESANKSVFISVAELGSLHRVQRLCYSGIRPGCCNTSLSGHAMVLWPNGFFTYSKNGDPMANA